MDSYREYPGEYDRPAAEVAPAADVTIAIGSDERRMHVRAYNYWVSLLEGRDYPSIEDLEPGDVADFAANSVLLDFTCGRDNPATPYIGSAIREECDLDDGIKSIAEIDMLIPHQANLRINQMVAQMIGMPPEKTHNNIQKYGNTTAASIPICMHEAIELGKIKSGDLVCLVAFGAGLTWGSAFLRY